MTLVHLLRHGAVENPRSVRYGLLPGFPLSERGRAQVEAAARYLRERGGIAAVVSSPLVRAVETAEIVERVLELPRAALDDRLREAPSQFDGLPKTAFLHPAMWSRLRNPFRPSWGEPFDEVARRMCAAIADHRDAHPDRELVVVSHQSPIWIAHTAYASRRPVWLTPRRCAYASITTLSFDGDRYTGSTYWAPPR